MSAGGRAVAHVDAPALLVDAILAPERLAALDMAAWERLLACARRNAVLAYLAERAMRAGLIDSLPEAPRAALHSARTSAARLSQLARWELERVRRAFAPAAMPLIALKGVAYVVRGLPHATTRILSDIDVMVPRDRIGEAEQALVDAGWQGTKLDAYDQKYYREWSHEIPPLHYPGRLLSVDVHHTICPPVSRLRPDAAQFWADAEPCEIPGVRLLSPVDSVLHAAVHLFFDSDFDGRFRELVDLHELLTAFGGVSGFWDALIARAKMQGLGRPLYYTFVALTRVLRTPVPAAALAASRAFAPPPLTDRWMTNTLETVLTPVDPQIWPPANRARLWLLFVRSHWLRMPAHLLVPHLVRKSMRRVRVDPLAAPR